MEETRKCPYCSEEILATARKCKHCGEWLDGSHQTSDNHERKNNKHINWPWVCGICAAIILCAIIIFIITNSNNRGGKDGGAENEKTEQKPINPLDINEKTVFKIKSSRVTKIPLYYDLKTKQRTYEYRYPSLGDLSMMIFYPDTTGTLINSDGTKREVKCRYIEDELHGKTHKAIIFNNPAKIYDVSIRGIVIISEDYKVIQHIYNRIDPIGMESDAKTILAKAEENKANNQPDYILEREVPITSKASDENSPFDIKHFLQVVKKWDALESMLNSDGFILKRDDCEEYGSVWVKNCSVTITNDNCYPQSPSDSSVIIDFGCHRGIYFYITVWGQENADKLTNQLREIGYKPNKNDDNSYSFDEPSNEDTKISLEPQRFKEYGPNSYSFMLYVIAEDY